MYLIFQLLWKLLLNVLDYYILSTPLMFHVGIIVSCKVLVWRSIPCYVHSNRLNDLAKRSVVSHYDLAASQDIPILCLNLAI